MASIPLPALAVKTPEQPDLMGSMQKLMALKSMMGQQQIQQQTIQQNTQAITDQKARTKAMTGWDGKDPNELAQSVLRHGGSADAATQVAKHFLDVRDTASQVALRDAQTGETNLKTTIEKHNQWLGGLTAGENVPDDQLQDHLAKIMNQLATDPNDAQQMAVKQQVQQVLGANLPPAELRKQVDLAKAGIQGSKEQYEQVNKQAEAAKNNAQARSDNANAALKEIETQGLKALTPENVKQRIDSVFDPKDPRAAGQNHMLNAMVSQALQQGDLAGAQKILQDGFQKAIQAQSQIQVDTDPKVLAGKVLVAKNTAQARQDVASGGYGQPGSPEVAMVGNGEVDLATALSRVPASAKHTFLNSLNSDFPEYSQATYGTIKGVMKDFTSGKSSDQLKAFNTAITHMGVFRQLADELGNTDVRVVNQLGNAIGVQFGSDKATNFDIAKKAFMGETARAFDGAGVTQGDRHDFDEQIARAGSPSQLKGAADTAERLLRGKRDVLKQQFDEGVKGKPNFQGGGASGTPAGATHTAMGADGKKHYTNAQGQDLGVVAP